jgi:hypothetical protein
MTREQRFNAAALAYGNKFGTLFDCRMVSPQLYARLPEEMEQAVLSGQPLNVPSLSVEQLTIGDLTI